MKEDDFDQSLIIAVTYHRFDFEKNHKSFLEMFFSNRSVIESEEL